MTTVAISHSVWKIDPKENFPRSGSGFGLRLALELGLGAIFLAGNFRGTISHSVFIYQMVLLQRQKLVFLD